ncbi:MAG: type II toxin-antitoxin system HicA family toxin [Bacteroidota bacterium]
MVLYSNELKAAITYKHPNGKRTIAPLHNKDIPKGTLNAILKQAGLK